MYKIDLLNYVCSTLLLKAFWAWIPLVYFTLPSFPQ